MLLHGDDVPLVPIPAAGDVDAGLVERGAVDGPAGGEDLGALVGRGVEEDGALAEERGRVHGGDDAAGVEVDGGGLGEEGDDVDVVGDAGGVFGQRPRVVRVGVVAGDVVDRLGPVEEEDVFLLRRHGHFGRAGFVRADEDGGHLEKGAVVQVAVVVGFARLHQFRLGRGVRGADVVRFAPVVPGDHFDVVGLYLQQFHPAVDVDVRVLRVQPVGVAGKALEEPRGYARHPGLAIGVARVGVGLVDGSFFGGGERRMNPGEGTCTAVGDCGLV